MPRQVKSMPLAFEASQKLDLPVRTGADRLPTYLLEEDFITSILEVFKAEFDFFGILFSASFL